MQRVEHRVRAADKRDLEAINDIYNAYVTESHVTFDATPLTMEQRITWFREHADPRHVVLVAVVNGAIAGYATSGRHRPRAGYETTVETSAYVAPAHVGQGVGTSLYTALFDALAGKDLHRALAGIAQPNEPSEALHRRFGFRRVAQFTEQGRKFGRYWDVDWYERALE